MTDLKPETERRLQRIMDLGERLLIVLIYAGFAVRIFRALELHPFNVLALISETIMVVMILVRRPADTVSTRPLDWAMALMGTMAPLMVRPGGAQFLPEWVGGGLMLIGVSVAIWAKLSLRRSFGLAAANRGIVQVGAYRVVRHPMYLGYIITYVGFLLNNPLPWNAGLYVVAIALQIGRIMAEERVLMADPSYAEMSGRVRYRLIPGLF